MSAPRDRAAGAERRRALAAEVVPTIAYPALPVAERRVDLLAAIDAHQVVVVAGETGSGKTTQLPKLCLELGRGVAGSIGHTQPRRIAARAVAERIAEELGVELGGVVGYQVRFTQRATRDTLVKVMTDGVLLAEIAQDPMLRRYDTLILDEAHERSLNIDFLLGYLARLLPQRPDLKLVITSATIDVERFSRHFGGAPVVEVSGRVYPVEVRYRPLAEPPSRDEDDDTAPPAPRDQVQGICDAVQELAREGPGDVLVFLSGEREIRDAADALRGLDLRDTEVLPLYGRLSAAEQHRVFTAHTGRRVVLATNVAETSLTVPGIRYVVDPGTARISRYSQRLKVQRLPIEPISQASARQRAGRCGRLSDGICIRLYSEADHDARPEFTEPEILRTSLASVILRMADLRLGDVAAFPFLDPPDQRQIASGVQLLEELGALDPQSGDDLVLTAAGRQMARLPVDPRLARMLVAADGEGCLREVLVLAAALSVQDPRERPTDAQEAADEAHARFVDPRSDFLAYLNLWAHLREQQQALSGNAFRRLCRREFLNYLRVREWQDLHAQLRQLAQDLGLARNSAPAESDAVHRALLAGLLSQVGVRIEREPAAGRSRSGSAGRPDPRRRERREYEGARGARFAIAPGSALAKAAPAFVMAAELVETNRLWARVVAGISPEWVEEIGAHLVMRYYSEPHWDPRRGAAMAYERVTLYGVTLIADRRAQYARVDPAGARELFLRHALVLGEWRTHHAFAKENARRRHEAEEVERRARRRGLVADDEALLDFFDARVPADVVSARHFDRWWKAARAADPDLLVLPTSVLLPSLGEESADGLPDAWVQGALRLALAYRFEPGHPDDGVTVRIPLAVLPEVRPDGFDWQVPGLREELAAELIRTLPKALRRSFVPAATYAGAVLDAGGPGDGLLVEVAARALTALGGPRIAPGDFAVDRLPAHLRMGFRVEDERGAVLARGRDLAALQRQLAATTAARVSSAAAEVERAGRTAWDFGPLRDSVAIEVGGQPVRGYPAVVDEGDSVALRVLPTRAGARRATRAGVRRLVLLQLPSPVRAVVQRLDGPAKLALATSPYPAVPALLDACVEAAVDSLVAEQGEPPQDAAEFALLLGSVRPALHARTQAVVAAVAEALGAAGELRLQLDAPAAPALADAWVDLRLQLRGLLPTDFVTALGWPRLAALTRYLRAALIRVERARVDAARDAGLMAQAQVLEDDLADWLATVPPERRDDPAVAEVRWMLEELRVSLMAPGQRTAYPVSAQRIRKAMTAAWPGGR